MDNPYLYGYCTCVFGLLEGEITVEDTRRLPWLSLWESC